MSCPRFIRQGTAESLGRAPACFTERVKKRGHRFPGVQQKAFRYAEGLFFAAESVPDRTGDHFPSVSVVVKGMPQK